MKKERLLCSGIGGFLFGLATVLGKAVYDHNTIQILFKSDWNFIKTITQLFLYTILSGLICLILWDILDKISKRAKENKKQWKFLKSKYLFPVCWITTFLGWIPCYLAYYPGILSYDSNVQTLMARRIWTWTTHHPPVHTFLWKVCLSAGYRLGIEPIIIYALLQMIILSGCLSIVVKYLVDRNCTNLVIVFAFAFYTFNPVIAILSFVMTKDIYFAAFLVMFSIILLELMRDTSSFMKRPTCYIAFISCVTVSCLLRNNFIYVYVLLLPILWFVLRRERKSYIILIVAPIVITMIFTKLIYPLVGIEEGDTKESLSVPMQQIALVAETENLSKEIQYEIHRFIPDTSVYNPRFADPIKFVFSEEEFKENKIEFFSLWWKLLKEYPIKYADAFLALNIPSWYPGTDWIDSYSEREYIETYIYQGSYTFERKSIFPKLYIFYEKIAEGTVLERIPVLSYLFSINTTVWILLFTTLYLFTRKDLKKNCIPMMFLLLWLTYMAGPVSCLRYIFPVMIMYPFFIWMWLEREI